MMSVGAKAWLEKTVAEIRGFLLPGLSQELEKGPQPADFGPKKPCPPREANARFCMFLEDGVMINSAVLWPLLEPLWNTPKTWWFELVTAQGRKDYDWSKQAMRYFPTRVEEKCKVDPSLAVAHGLFWKYHPEKAYQWEQRLQSPDELGPDFKLVEDGYARYKSQFEQQEPDKVRELVELETKRRGVLRTLRPR